MRSVAIRPFGHNRNAGKARNRFVETSALGKKFAARVFRYLGFGTMANQFHKTSIPLRRSAYYIF
jgi:hypothetical protein